MDGGEIVLEDPFELCLSDLGGKDHIVCMQNET